MTGIQAKLAVKSLEMRLVACMSKQLWRVNLLWSITIELQKLAQSLLPIPEWAYSFTEQVSQQPKIWPLLRLRLFPLAVSIRREFRVKEWLTSRESRLKVWTLKKEALLKRIQLLMLFSKESKKLHLNRFSQRLKRKMRSKRSRNRKRLDSPRASLKCKRLLPWSSDLHLAPPGSILNNTRLKKMTLI